MTHIAISTPHQIKGKALGTRILRLISLARQRHALSRLGDHTLEDIGLTRTEARIEASRPIWDAPDNWLKHRY